jgi:endonuclease/exonuclease/phosphatase family metal-dependent hydrolase
LEIRVVVWNVAWRKGHSKSGRMIRSLIEQEDLDLVFLTEGYPGALNIHEAKSDPDYGYAISNRRKVLLYSRTPWRDVVALEDSVSPSGRLVSGVARISGADISCFGVCVPWKMAHVSTGRRDRSQWQDHKQFLQTFGRHLGANGGRPTIVAGDFNQHIPRKRQPVEVFEQLVAALPAPMTCVTASGSSGVYDMIDHVFVSEHFRAIGVRALSNRGEDGRVLSDHHGLSVKLQLRH